MSLLKFSVSLGTGRHSIKEWYFTRNEDFDVVNHLKLISQLCLTLSDPMDCSTPGLPVHHQLLEFTQTHVH